MILTRWLAAILLIASTASAQIRIEGLPDEAPFTLEAKANATHLVLDVAMQPEWHLYAEDVGGGQPVSLSLLDSSDFASAGSLVTPESADGKLRGSFRLELPLQARRDGGRIEARFDFMACDPLACLQPMSATIVGTIETSAPLRVLLAVDEASERSDRIAKLLSAHKIGVSVQPYKTLTKQACDAADVVLADSKLFRKDAKGTRQLVLEFPKTSSPIVAVGFLGTELIEAHGIAMTSGYI